MWKVAHADITRSLTLFVLTMLVCVHCSEQDPSEELYDCVRNEYEKEDEIYEDLMSIRKRASVQSQPVSVSSLILRNVYCIEYSGPLLYRTWITQIHGVA